MDPPRIYVPVPLAAGERVELTEQATHHVVKVLRLNAGTALTLFNGQGGEYTATLQTTGSRRAEVDVGEFCARDVESNLKITLAQGVSRRERMDYTIQKAVELGVARIIPLFLKRTVVTLRGSRLDRRLEHWRAVAASACEQCGRNVVPQILAPPELDACLSRSGDGPRLLLDPGARLGPGDLPPPREPVTLLIGPEGGLAPEERQHALAAGFTGLRLGPRILRTETAGLTALAAMQALWGDLA